MSVFENRSQRKKFDKLGNDAKKEAMNVAIQNEFGKVLAKHVSQAMVDGMDLQSNHLYTKFVSKIDSGVLSEAEKTDCIEHLLSAIRKGHINYVKKNGKEGEDMVGGVPAE